uniref:CHCH domain-containing protein n=1 Tax=Onchocerca volvulus TaxID=6282 RepID=A0A2K6VU89_ONCVO
MSRIQATQKFKLLVSVLPGRNFCIASQMDRLKSLGRQLFGVSWKSWEMDDGAGGGDVIHRITEEEYDEPIQDPYVESLARMSYAELDDKYNPGPTLPDGSVNFECHCVGHLVASPCGYEFREAIKCQKSAGEAALNEGACATEFMNFMQCVIRTGCFKSSRNLNDEGEEGQENADLEDSLNSDETSSKIHSGA